MKHVVSLVDPQAVLLTALLNPAVIVVAVWLGRRADQWQKLPIAAFAAALAGSALVHVGVQTGVPGVAGLGRAVAGVFIAQFLFGLVWAAVGYYFGWSLLGLWLAMTAVALTGLAIWALVPVLAFFLILVAALGLVSVGMIALAHALRRWRENPAEAGSDPSRGGRGQPPRASAFL